MAERSSGEEEKLEDKNSLNSFPKILRVKKRFEYRNILKARTRFFGQSIVINYRTNNSLSYARMGITITTKFGKAHERNRFKRLSREAFRRNFYKMPNNLEINISSKKSLIDLKADSIEKDLLSFLDQLKTIK